MVVLIQIAPEITLKNMSELTKNEIGENVEGDPAEKKEPDNTKTHDPELMGAVAKVILKPSNPNIKEDQD